MPKGSAAEKVTAGLRQAEVCPNVTGRAKDRITQTINKRIWAGLLAIVD